MFIPPVKAIQRQLGIPYMENSLCFVFRHFSQPQIILQAQGSSSDRSSRAQGQFFDDVRNLTGHQQALKRMAILPVR